MRRFFATLAVLADLAIIGAIIVFVGSRFSTGLADLRRRIEDSLRGYELWFGFVVALTATLGSLYFSEIVHLEPCKFCWYQRIAMYPLTVILGTAAWLKDRSVVRYVTPLAVIGALISSYHYLIQQFPSLSAGECDPTVPCSAAYFWEFGFVSIPFLALSSFGLIITLMVVAMSNNRRPQPDEQPEDQPA